MINNSNVKAVKLNGTSMLPLFKEGDIALIKSAIHNPQSAISPGDCIVYNHCGRKLLHRVIKTKQNGAWISDDAGLIEPHFVKWENVDGKVLSKNPFTCGLLGFVYYKIRKFLSTKPALE